MNLKTFNTPVKVKLFESPGKAGGLPILITERKRSNFDLLFLRKPGGDSDLPTMGFYLFLW
jgi:hypothetical protein